MKTKRNKKFKVKVCLGTQCDYQYKSPIRIIGDYATVPALAVLCYSNTPAVAKCLTLADGSALVKLSAPCHQSGSK